MSIGTMGRDVLRNRGAVSTAGPLAVVLGGAFLCASFTGVSQTAGVNQGGPDYIHSPAGLSPMPQHGSTEAESKVEQMRQAERHRRLLADTAKLVELSNQLKTEIDQAPKDQLSVETVRKAAEIEKTAHDLNGWMKY